MVKDAKNFKGRLTAPQVCKIIDFHFRGGAWGCRTPNSTTAPDTLLSLLKGCVSVWSPSAQTQMGVCAVPYYDVIYVPKVSYHSYVIIIFDFEKDSMCEGGLNLALDMPSIILHTYLPLSQDRLWRLPNVRYPIRSWTQRTCGAMIIRFYLRLQNALLVAYNMMRITVP